MKPLGVLAIVLVAVAGLFFALSQLGGGEVATDPQAPGLTSETAEEAPQAPADTTPLAAAGAGERAEVEAAPETERADAAPELGEQFDNRVTGLVISSDRAPVAGARVTLTLGGTASRLFVNEELDRSSDRHTETDAEGRYAFQNVAPSNQYSVEVTAEGYSRNEIGGVVVDALGTLELPAILLTSGASLSGTVLDTAGNTVPGALVRLDGMFTSLDGTPSADSLEVESGPDGRYKIPNVAPGNRTLNVTAEGYANQTKGGLVFRGEEPLTMDVTLEIAEMICGKVISKSGAPVAGAKVLAMSFSNANKQCRDTVLSDENGEFCLTRVAAGQYTIAVTAPGFRAGHENRVKTGGAGLVIELVEQGMVSGRVIAGDGPPAGAYTVQLRQTHPGQKITSRIGKAETFTNPDGTFTIECAQSGTYLVEAGAKGFAPTFSEEFRFTQGQPMQNVIVRLAQGGRITGQVVGADGEPIARPTLTTHANDWTNSLFDRALGDQFPTNATLTTATGGGAGRFQLQNLNPETYQVRVRAPGYCEATIKDVLVTEGQATDLGKVQLIRGGEVTGSVIDAAGKAVAGARVNLNPDTQSAGEMPQTYTVKTGPDGKYRIPNVVPGRYKISAARGGQGGGTLFDDFISEQESAQVVTVSDGDTLRFELKVN
jgi:protocatechuate 3,4-dioxygenase beta subunit